MEATVASGEYADASEVIADGRTFLENDEQRLQRWLREEVVPVCLEMDANPPSAISSAKLRVALENDRKTRESV